MGPNGATGAVYLADRDLPQRPVALMRAPGVSLWRAPGPGRLG